MNPRFTIVGLTMVLSAFPVSGFGQKGLGCLVCSFKTAAEATKLGQDPLCDDLFGAACLGADGRSKYENRSKKINQELMNVVDEARDQTAKAMGFKNFDEAAKAKLKEAGLDLKDKVDQESWEAAKRASPMGDFANGGPSLGARLYSSVDQCHREVSALEEGMETMEDPSEFHEILRAQESLRAKYEPLTIKAYAHDIPTFIAEHLGPRCSAWKENPEVQKLPENKKAAGVCRNFNQLKRKAVELFRKEGSPQYLAEAENFVKEHYLGEFKMEPPRPTATAAVNSIARAERKAGELQNTVRSLCDSYGSLVENAGAKVLENFVTSVNRSKPTVDTLIDNYYGDRRKDLAERVFTEAKLDIQRFASQLVKDPAKREKILNGYDGLHLHWLEKPSDSAYKSAGQGPKVLDEDKAVPSSVGFGEDVYAVFSDASLSHFTSLNASYTPDMAIGQYKGKEKVNMMPAFIRALDRNPYSFLAVVAHEAGHKIGPEISKINGHDLNPEYQELLACYKDRKSIRMQKKQADEVIADYISSEVLANQIAKLPADKRKAALMSAMEDFCIFDDADHRQHSVRCNGEHPESTLRVNGIYGANPNLRKIVGCEKDPPRFRPCGLKFSLAPLLAGEQRDSTAQPPPPPPPPVKGTRR